VSPLLAGLAAALLVAATWEALGGLVNGTALERMSRVLGPARSAGRDGREPQAAERRRLLAVSLVALGGSGWMLSGPVAACVVAALAPLAATAVPRTRRSRWRRRAAAGAAPAARALADALAAGCPLQVAIGRAARDGGVSGPARALLAEAGAAIGLGEPLPSALHRLATRAGGGAWTTMTAAMLLQRETGGDLASLLRDFAAALEAAERAEGRSRAASAQARLTAKIVLGLPLAGLASAELLAPGTLEAVGGDPRARLMVAAALLLQLVSVAAVRRITWALR
jgi:tight adherence protein B